MRKQIIHIMNMDTSEYFFTIDHCQPHDLGKQWVSMTQYLPLEVVPRPELPSGVVATKEDWKVVFGKSMVIGGPVYKEIPNPQPEYQA